MNELRIVGPDSWDLTYTGKTIEQACEHFAGQWFRKHVDDIEVKVWAIEGATRYGPIKCSKRVEIDVDMQEDDIVVERWNVGESRYDVVIVE